MISAKQVVITAISNKGIDAVKAEATELAEGLLCSRAHVLNIVRQYEKGQIIIKRNF